MLKAIKGTIITCLFIAYPYLIYKGIENGLSWIAPTIFATIYFVQALAAKSTQLRVKKIIIAITLMLGAYYLQTITAKIIPVLIQLMLMYFFGRTLLEGKGPPLIESFARLEFPEFPEYVSPYCKKLTIIWTSFFAMNAVMCVLLAVWGSNYWWTLYSGVFIYVMIGILSVAEFFYRHYHFPEFVIPDMKSSFKTMFINGRKLWLDVHAR
ncbi:MAG: hypothetical protein KAH20_11090 [Methylococcales bacterium]|nr:hypothetical protein [Methylococcales bacterium]